MRAHTRHTMWRRWQRQRAKREHQGILFTSAANVNYGDALMHTFNQKHIIALRSVMCAFALNVLFRPF